MTRCTLFEQQNGWQETFRGTELEVLWDLEALQRDPGVAELILSGRTMGCFYIESASMRSLFQRIRCECYEDVVAASSIIRPGVAESGMMREYIERRRDPRKIKHLHPRLGELLSETYGVMVYQEDVIKVVHALGGLTMGEADVLRRAMSAKLGAREAMESLTERFFAGCRERGVPQPLVEELWRQIETFARFSFCKGHSAAFAVLSYQVTWLKAHYPAEFMAAVLANGGGYYGAAAYIQECRRMGLRVLGPDVNESEVDYTGKTERRNGTKDEGPRTKDNGAEVGSGKREVGKANVRGETRGVGGKIEEAFGAVSNRKSGIGNPESQTENPHSVFVETADTSPIQKSKGAPRGLRPETENPHSAFVETAATSRIQNPKSKIQNPVGWIRVGFGAIKNFPLDLARRIVRVRHERPFEGLEDFLRRVRPGHEAAEKLIRVGAFDRFGVSCERLLLDLDIYFRTQTDNGCEQLVLGPSEEPKEPQKA